MAEIWKNWAGNQRALVEPVKPTTEHELCAIVARAADEGRSVKAIGAGHSFSDIALTDGAMLSPEHYARVLSLDVDAGRVTVQAGATVHDVSQYLWSRGFAFENLGNSDAETVAGAASTASHGTGKEFATFAAGIVGMRIITGTGEVIECDEQTEPDLLRIARVGVGALGIISSLTMAVVPAFNLHTIEEPLRIDDVTGAFGDLLAANDHFSFTCSPHTEWAVAKSRRRNQDARQPRNRLTRWRDKGLVASAARMIPGPPRREYNERCFEAFPSPRRGRFVEMEYAVPLEATVEALGAIRKWSGASTSGAMLPIEVRAGAGDDIALSIAHGRPTGYIAVRAERGVPFERYFRAVEDIMVSCDGRPHWGMIHFRTAEGLRDRYPDWDDFQHLRARLDPQGVFENTYTRRVLGPLVRSAG